MTDKSLEVQVGEAVIKSGVGQDLAKKAAKKEAKNLKERARSHFLHYKWHYLGIAIYLVALLGVLIEYTLACGTEVACNKSLWYYGISPRILRGLLGMVFGEFLVATWLGLAFTILMFPPLAIQLMAKSLIEFFAVTLVLCVPGGLIIWALARGYVVHPNIPLVGYATYLLMTDILKYGFTWMAALKHYLLNGILVVVIVASSFNSISTLSWEGFLVHGALGVGFAFMWHYLGTKYIFPAFKWCWEKMVERCSCCTCCSTKSEHRELHDVVAGEAHFDDPVNFDDNVKDDGVVQLDEEDSDAKEAAKLTVGIGDDVPNVDPSYENDVNDWLQSVEDKN